MPIKLVPIAIERIAINAVSGDMKDIVMRMSAIPRKMVLGGKKLNNDMHTFSGFYAKCMS